MKLKFWIAIIVAQSVISLTATAADDPVRVHVAGIWWVAAAGCTDANLGALMGPLVTSDNPADIKAQSASDPFGLGQLIHVDVTAASGWINLDGDRGLANA